MPATWPISLQTLVNEESFSYKIGNTVLRSDMDVGPSKVRRRFTKSVDQLTVTINLTTDQFDTFMDFFDVDCNGGATTFNYTHPITGLTQEFRFVDAPNFSSIGGGNFRVAMSWEILP